MCCRGTSSSGMSRASRRPRGPNSAFCRLRTRRETSPRSCSASLFVSFWMVMRRRSEGCALGCRSVWMLMSARREPIRGERVRSRPTLGPSEGIRLRRYVYWILYRPAGHPDRLGFIARYWRWSFGGHRRNGLGADELPHRRDHCDSPVRLVVACHVNSLVVLCVRGWLHRDEHAVRSRVG